MRDPHLIEHLHVEVGFDGGPAVPEAEARLAAFARGPALQIIDELFDEASGPDEVWRIDELAIDLGEVAADGMEESWALRLRERLQDRLATLRGPGGAAAARSHAAGTQRSRPQARLEALLHFLLHGHLPWHGRGEDPARLAADVLRDSAGALADGLRAIGDRPRLLRRLAAQFDAGWLALLVQALMPGEPAAAARLLGIVTAVGGTRLRSDGQGAAVLLWEAVLDRALAPAGSSRDATLPLLRAQLLAALDAGAVFSESSDPLAAVAPAWAPLLKDDREWLRSTLQRLGDNAALRQRIVRALPAALLQQVLGLWFASGLTQAVGTWIASVAAGAPASADELAGRRQVLWQATLQHALQRGAAPFDAMRYVSDLRSQVAASPEQAGAPHWFERAVRAASSVLSSAAAVLGLRRKAPPALPAAPPPDAAVQPALEAPFEAGPAAPSLPEMLPVGNAGLVLVSTYLPRLFVMLGLSDERAFANPQAAERAVLLLQLLVTGQARAAEPALLLNKLLCGLDPALPVPREIEPSDAERAAVEGLLGAVIQHWKILGSTSVAGLRETFLQRDGRLQRTADHWQLQVEPRTFDMLIDQLPWGYSTIRHPWMEQVLHVDWR